MIWNAARGGMRSVVEAYERDGFLDRENVTLIASYSDGGLIARQILLLKALGVFLWHLVTKRVALVHCHAAMRGSFWRKNLFASIARLFGVPVVLHLHGSEMKPFYASQSKFRQALIRRHLERATCVLVLSESWRSFVSSIAPAARITVLPNYVSMPPLIEPAQRQAQEILFLGLIGDRKGVFDLIPAFQPVHAAHPQARLTIAGNGEVERADSLVRELGLQNGILLPGWTDGAAKAALLERAAIYILPSHNEGLPMSVLEAMAQGMAVVTTRVGGIPELMTDEVDGLLVDAGDHAALTHALKRLLSDTELRERLMRAARARIEQSYSDRAVLPLLHSIYRECERGSGGPRRAEPAVNLDGVAG